MVEVYLGLGSNIGDKEGYLTKAVRLLSELYQIKKTSHLYLTEPVGGIKQEWFLNCVVEIETECDPKRLLSSLHSIERQCGRKKTVKNGPRTLDIDILFYGDQIIKIKALVVPHPQLHERLFVLRPMMDLNPSFIHPLLKKSIQEIIESHPWTKKVTLYK